MSAKPTSPPPAYFLSLNLENVRSFGEKQVIDFTEKGAPAPWTVILGDNGVGKTSVLKAISLMAEGVDEDFGDKTIAIRYYVPDKWNPLRRDGKHKALINASYSSGQKLKEIRRRNYYEELEITAHIGYEANRGPGFVTAKKKYLDYPAGDLICYGYGASRTTGKSTLGDIASAHNCISLFDEHADLLNAEEWFLQADYRIKSDDSPLIRQNFELLKAALIDILDEVAEIKVSPVAPGGNPQQGLQFLTPYGWVRLREMSLGYQTMVVWITDFASKLFIRYPESKNPLAEPAIVLIDEIDLHLHPEWQRKLIGYLSRLFPNTQFIATAHSPLVVQAAGDAGANVVLLKRVGDQTVVVQNVEDVRGWRVDQILSSELFDSTPARSPATEEKLARRRALLAKKKLTKADKEALAQLNADLPPLPFGDTPEVQQADARIQALLQKLGKQPNAA